MTRLLVLRMRGLLLLAVSLLATSASAQWWDPFPKAPNAPEPQPSAYDYVAFSKADFAVNSALGRSGYEKIERMYAEFMQGPMRTTDGRLMIEAFQRGMDKWFEFHDDATIARMFSEWKQKVPDSRLRGIAEADMWQRRAWVARTGGSASQVTPEGFELFKERLGKAAQALEASKDAGKDSPIWYWVALIVAGSSGASTQDFDALFKEAVTRFPTYMPLYLTRVNYLLPQWGGNYRQVDRFVDAAVNHTKKTEGTSFYALIYADVARKYRGDDFFGDTLAKWPRMRQSFEDLNKLHPSPWNKAMYAGFACMARDRDTTAKLLTEMPGETELGAGFLANITAEGCRRFAFPRT